MDSEDEDEHNSGSTWVPRTDYQMCLTDVPDDEGDLSRDLYALQTVDSEVMRIRRIKPELIR